jgi:hypothetical protein
MCRVWIRNFAWRSLALLVVLSPAVGRATAQQSPAPATSHSKANKPKKAAGARPLPSFREDWSSITLENSNLTPDVPVLGEKDDLPESTFIRERFQFQWRPGDPLDLYVIRPKGAEKPPVVLYLYSFPQDTDRFKNDRWCADATRDGFAAIGFVSALTGHRAEHRALKEWFVSELQESLASSAHDVEMILNHLATRGDLDMDRVGMFGQGSGGTIAILAAAADPRIKALDVLTPWGDWPNWLAKSTIVPDDERANYLTPEFLARVAQLDPVLWLAKVKAKSVRIQNVRKESKVPDSSQQRVEAAAPDIAEINQYGDGGALYPMAAGGKLFDWLKEHLKPDAKLQVAADKSGRVHFYPGRSESTR